jgi:hypothetical protein
LKPFILKQTTTRLDRTRLRETFIHDKDRTLPANKRSGSKTKRKPNSKAKFPEEQSKESEMNLPVTAVWPKIHLELAKLSPL